METLPALILPLSFGWIGSQFWKSFVKIREVRSLVKFIVGSDSSTWFWLDWWSGHVPLKINSLIFCDA